MFRQLVFVACLVAFVHSACVTIGPTVMGSCPPGFTKVTNPEQNCDEQCALPSDVAGCAGSCGGGGGGGSCTDVVPNCAAWQATGFCTSTLYNTAQKQKSCARTCGLC